MRGARERRAGPRRGGKKRLFPALRFYFVFFFGLISSSAPEPLPAPPVPPVVSLDGNTFIVSAPANAHATRSSCVRRARGVAKSAFVVVVFASEKNHPSNSFIASRWPSMSTVCPAASSSARALARSSSTARFLAASASSSARRAAASFSATASRFLCSSASAAASFASAAARAAAEAKEAAALAEEQRKRDAVAEQEAAARRAEEEAEAAKKRAVEEERAKARAELDAAGQTVDMEGQREAMKEFEG